MEKQVYSNTHSTKPSGASPTVPPPPYFKHHFKNPSSFKSAVNEKLDNPLASLFQLSIRILQLIFAFASGISYAIELSHGNATVISSLIFAQVAFGATIVTLIIYGITLRYYRFSWVIEWVLAVFWFALFGFFYEIFLENKVESYEDVDIGRMKRAVWCNLINAILWTGSAIFGSIMCCSGAKGAVKAKLERRRQRKEGKKMITYMGQMETGTVPV